MATVRLLWDSKLDLASHLEFLDWLANQEFCENLEIIDISTPANSSEASDYFASFFHKSVKRTLIALDAFITNKLEKSTHEDTPVLISNWLNSGDQSVLGKVRFVRGTHSEEMLRQLEVCDLVVLVGGSSGSAQNITDTSVYGVISLQVSHLPVIDSLSNIFDSVSAQKSDVHFSIHLDVAGNESSTILRDGKCATKFLAAKTQKLVLAYAFHYMQLAILQVLAGKNNFSTRDAAHTHTQKPPATSASLVIYFIYMLRRVLKKVLHKVRHLDFPKWNVYFYRGGWTEIANAEIMKLPVQPGNFIADPFLIHQEGKDYCFVEELDSKTMRGHIAAYEILNNEAKYLGPVIKEPFHMSFPYLFRFNDQIYMCPEISEAKELRLYQAENFPFGWKCTDTLFTENAMADSMIFERNNVWWMLTNFDPTESGDFCVELNLFWSEDPTTNAWNPHPLNPILVDSSCARNAGLLIQEDKLYRVSQVQGFDCYGAAFQVNEITAITKTSYSEVCVKKFFPSDVGTKKSAHHLHSNGTVTVFDGI